MKKYLLLLILISILSINSAYALSDGIIESAAEIGYPPFSIVNEDGEADGFSVELLRAALKSQGQEVTFYVGPWNQVKEDLAEGKIQVLPLVGRTPEREPIYDFTEPYITFYGTIFVRDNEVNIKSVEDLANKEVLVMEGDNAHEYAIRSGLKNIIATTTYEEAFKLLSEGNHDALISHAFMGEQIIKSSNLKNVVSTGQRIEGFRQDFTFAVTEGDTELLELLDKGLVAVNKDGTYDELHKKWFLEEKTSSYDLIKIVAIGILFLGLIIWGLIVILKKIKNYEA